MTPPPAQAMQVAFEHLRAGRLVDAESACRQMLSSHPDDPNALQLMGVISGQTGKHDAAEAFFRRAVEVAPHVATFHLNLGLALDKQGKLRDAVQCCRRALAISPDDPSAHNQLGVFFRKTGDLDQSIASHERAIQLKPNFAWAWNNLGNALLEMRAFDRAIECYGKAVALEVGNHKFQCGLANALKGGGQTDHAFESFQQALAIRNDDPDALGGIAGVLLETGEIDSAIRYFRRALNADPSSITTHDQLLFALLHDPACTLQNRAVENRRWNHQHAKPLPQLPPRSIDLTPDRKLRIGYISADFRAHAVGLFLAPLFAEHDRKHFEIFCYSQVVISDAQTAWFQSRADGWRNIVGKSDEEAARQIQDDRIDILVDLSMHTAGNRLLVFARKPAPVQVTYLAYAGGTALPAIDYRLTDCFLDPDETNDRFYSEKTFRLNSTYWCYSPSPAAVEFDRMQPVQHEQLTFGCLNKFSKVSTPVLSIWAQLLNRVPDSQLILHAPPGRHRQRVIDFFAEYGITNQRIEFVPHLSTAEYFQTYLRTDIELDPFPYAGGTTTCDALWMGVPVVTLAGRSPSARAGVSILSNAGFPELIGSAPEQYVQIAVDLAQDRTRLSSLREAIMQRVRKSPLTDRQAYARSIEAAFRRMWQIHCAGGSPRL